MRSAILVTSLLTLSAGLMACGFAVRSPDMFRDDTQKVLETRSPEMKACYDGILKGDKTAAGNVTVKFDVELETGKFVNLKVDETATTAPPPVRECVMNALQGLAVKPPDGNLGKATFVWAFQPGAPPPAPAPVAAGK
jgi:hypothetical protein